MTQESTGRTSKVDLEAERLALRILNTSSSTKEIKVPREAKRYKALRIIDLRIQGKTFEEIARLLDYKSARHARSAYEIQMRKHEKESIDNLRNIQNERIEMAWHGLVPKIQQGRERAIEVGMKVLERQARLHGLDAADAVDNKISNQPINILIMPHPGDQKAQQLIIEQDPGLNKKQLLPADEAL